jgi:hypothetical protein
VPPPAPEAIQQAPGPAQPGHEHAHTDHQRAQVHLHQVHQTHSPYRVSQWATGLFEQAEQLLILLVGLFLIGFAALSLFNTLVLIKDPIFVDHDYTEAISMGFDSAFLTIILLEVLHTVLTRSSLALQIREFLVIGITSAVRHSLEVAASSSATHTANQVVCQTVATVTHQTQRICHVFAVQVPNSSSQEVVIELAVNAGGVLLLVAAFWLVGQGREDKGSAL